MGSQIPPGNPTGGDNIAEAMRLFEEYKRRQASAPPPPPADTAGQGFGALFQRGFEAVAKPLGDIVGGAVHTAGIPARAVAAVGTNMFEGSAPVDVSDYALYGQDMETGAPAAHYGDILAGHLAETGEVAAGGIAEKLVRLAGNMITDPAMAAPMMGAAEGAASLAGRVGPSMPLTGNGGPVPGRGPGWRPQGPPGPPRSRLNPAYGPMPGQARPKFDPTATQQVRGAARVGGDLVDPTATQPVKTVKPTGSSMESKFVAKRAEGRPSGGVEEKFSRTRAPKEASNYRKDPAKKGKGAQPSKPKAKRKPKADPRAKDSEGRRPPPEPDRRPITPERRRQELRRRGLDPRLAEDRAAAKAKAKKKGR